MTRYNLTLIILFASVCFGTVAAKNSLISILDDQLVDSSCEGVVATVSISFGSYSSEISWELLDEQGSIVLTSAPYSYFQEDFTSQPICLNDGETYIFNSYDSYGDSWNGGLYSIETVSCSGSGSTILANNNGQSPNNGTFSPNDLEASETFTVVACEGMIFGCTDEMAFNYNPDANVSLDICLYVNDCIFSKVTIFGGDSIDSFVSTETSWTITDVNSVVYASGGSYDDSIVSISQNYCLPQGVLNFNVFNEFGLDWGDDTYSIEISCGEGLYNIADNEGEVPNIGFVESFEITTCLDMFADSAKCYYNGDIYYLGDTSNQDCEDCVCSDQNWCYTGLITEFVMPGWECEIVDSCNVYGCTDVAAVNYDINAIIDDNSCMTSGLTGCHIGDQIVDVGTVVESDCDNWYCLAIDDGTIPPDTIGGSWNAGSWHLVEGENCEELSADCPSAYLNEPMIVPDGGEENYSTAVDILTEEGQLLSESDNFTVFVNMEHSYAGDLDIYLTAPNGQQIQLCTQGGGATFFGEASDSDNTDSVPGIGYDYGWSMNPSYNGTMLDGYVDNIIDNPNGIGNILASDTYLPEESFDLLEGTPINGLWELTIVDNIMMDNGWVFSWGISLCEGEISGCMDSTAINFNPLAVIDDASCEYTVEGCELDGEFYTFGETVQIGCNSCFCEAGFSPSDSGLWACTEIACGGCTDPEALNYDEFAQFDDGSCEYAVEAITPNWDYPFTGSNHTIVIPEDVLVDINGLELASGDWLGVFYQVDGQSQPAGYAVWEETTTMIAAQGDDLTTTAIDGFINGDIFQWMLWDESENMIYLMEATYSDVSPNQEQFVVNGISSLVSLTAVPLIAEQELALVTGWNMFSTYMAMDDQYISDAFANFIDFIIIVKNNLGEAWLPNYNFDGIGLMQSGQGYQCKLNAPIDIVVEGDYLVPENNPIDLDNGWNLIAYFPITEYDVIDIFANVEDLVIVKDNTGMAYLPEYDFNGIGNMQAGKAYKVKVLSDQILQYPANE